MDEVGTLAERLAAQVMSLIAAEGLASDDRLPSIGVLATRFGVTAPTMREALRRLEASESVVIRHGSGVYVGPGAGRVVVRNPHGPGDSPELIRFLLSARATLEPPMAALAAEHRLGGDLERLESSVVNSDPDRSGPTRGHFHLDIARATGNPLLLQVLESLLSGHRSEQRAIHAATATRIEESAEHRTILDAIRDGDAERAQEAMADHLRALAGRVLTS